MAELKFKKKDQPESADRGDQMADLQKSYDAAMGHAQNLLQNEDFKKYREQYEGLQAKLIEELFFIDEVCFDPVRYGFMVKDVVAKMRHVGSLLKGVLNDAGK